MALSELQQQSTESLQAKSRFSQIALLTVWIGAGIAIAAVLFNLMARDLFPATTFITALIALLASIPVYRERRQVQTVLAERA